MKIPSEDIKRDGFKIFDILKKRPGDYVITTLASVLAFAFSTLKETMPREDFDKGFNKTIQYIRNEVYNDPAK